MRKRNLVYLAAATLAIAIAATGCTKPAGVTDTTSTETMEVTEESTESTEEETMSEDEQAMYDIIAQAATIEDGKVTVTDMAKADSTIEELISYIESHDVSSKTLASYATTSAEPDEDAKTYTYTKDGKEYTIAISTDGNCQMFVTEEEATTEESSAKETETEEETEKETPTPKPTTKPTAKPTSTTAPTPTTAVQPTEPQTTVAVPTPVPVPVQPTEPQTVAPTPTEAPAKEATVKSFTVTERNGEYPDDRTDIGAGAFMLHVTYSDGTTKDVLGSIAESLGQLKLDHYTHVKYAAEETYKFTYCGKTVSYTVHFKHTDVVFNTFSEDDIKARIRECGSTLGNWQAMDDMERTERIMYYVVSRMTYTKANKDLKNWQGTCDDYAQLELFLLKYYGIDATYMVSYSANHAYIRVNLKSGTYYLDSVCAYNVDTRYTICDADKVGSYVNLDNYEVDGWRDDCTTAEFLRIMYNDNEIITSWRQSVPQKSDMTEWPLRLNNEIAYYKEIGV